MLFSLGRNRDIFGCTQLINYLNIQEFDSSGIKVPTGIASNAQGVVGCSKVCIDVQIIFYLTYIFYYQCLCMVTQFGMGNAWALFNFLATIIAICDDYMYTCPDCQFLAKYHYAWFNYCCYPPPGNPRIMQKL